MGFNPEKSGDVWPIAEEMFSFYVRSRTNQNFPHTVDLESYKWAGQCDCEHYKFRCEPELSRGAPASDRLRCAHIKAARSYFLDEILPKIAAQVRGIGKSAPAEFHAQAILTGIYQSELQDADKLAKLNEVREHIAGLIEQIRDDIDSARDLEKHEDAPSVQPEPEEEIYEEQPWK